jgi:SAM-dependent methyltransferase
MKLLSHGKATVLKIRRHLPNGLRRFLRLSRLAFREGKGSVEMPPELIGLCRMCASRYELVAALPRRGRVLEVGTLHGDFARYILDACEPAELHLIDLDFSVARPDVLNDSRVVAHRGLSHETLADFPDALFDWIYIDADHAYESVKRDAEAAAAKVRPGGYLVFNDFGHMDPWLGSYGVHRAVVEFAVSRQWPFVWWAFQPNGLYDVALRRPEQL